MYRYISDTMLIEYIERIRNRINKLIDKLENAEIELEKRLQDY